MQKKFLIISLISLLLISGHVFALEVNYPKVPGMQETPRECLQLASQQRFPCYLKYIYHLSVTISGLICFFTILGGGFLYLISGGSAGKIKEAREIMLGGFLGAMILLSSYLILMLINPQLTVFSLSELERFEFPSNPIPPPTQESPLTYFQVPIGKIIKRVILEHNSNYDYVKETAIELEECFSGLQETAKKINDLIKECDCSEHISTCGSPPACMAGARCETDCDKNLIQANILKLKEDIPTCREKQDDMTIAYSIIERDFLELKKAGLLMSLPTGVIDYNTFLVAKYYQKETQTTTFPGWEDIKITDINGLQINDPFTFYFSKLENEEAIGEAERLTTVSFAPPGTQFPQPPQDGIPGARCALGTGYCRPENLSIFGEYAQKASIVCQAESGGNPYCLNTSCSTGKTCDYSVGLFQINLLPRCPGAFDWDSKTCISNPYCKIINQALVEQCKEKYGYGNSEVNIQKAYEIFESWGGWCPWGAAKVCNVY